MVLIFLVIIGVGVFCFAHGYIFTGAICLLGFSGKIGFIALIVASISLLIQGHWVVGVIPLLLIGVNLVFLPKSHKQMIKNKL